MALGVPAGAFFPSKIALVERNLSNYVIFCDFTSLPWLRTFPQGLLFFLKNTLFEEHISMYCKSLVFILGFKSGRL